MSLIAIDLRNLRTRIVPTAAAAAGPNTSNPRSRGRIQVRRESDSGVYYLSKVLPENSMSPGRVMVTQRLAEALEVEYLSPSDNPQALLIPDVSSFSPCPKAMLLTFHDYRTNFQTVICWE